MLPTVAPIAHLPITAIPPEKGRYGMIDITQHGVTPGNTPDANRVALQALVNSTYNQGAAVLYVPCMIPLSIDAATGYAIRLQPGVSFRGEQQFISGFKLAPNQGNYLSIFLREPQWISGFVYGADFMEISNLTFDASAPNPVNYTSDQQWKQDITPGRIAPNARMGIWCGAAQKLTIKDCRFLGFDSIGIIGINQWSLGGGGGRVQNVDILNCLFDNVGGSTLLHDHECIYLFGSDCRIKDCTFYGVMIPDANGLNTKDGYGNITPIEVHGNGHVVQGNIVRWMTEDLGICGAETLATDNIFMGKLGVKQTNQPNEPLLTNNIVGMNVRP